MKPPQDAERISSDVSSRVLLDEDRLRAQVSARFVPGAYWHDLIEAERVAGEVVADPWGDLAGACDHALAEVHELYLAQAVQVLEAKEDLRQNGAESWIARAVNYQRSFNLAWDVLDEKGLLSELSD